MLSYDQPVPVNGQAPSAPENTPAAPASVVAMATPQTAYPVDETVSTGSQHRPNGQTGSQHQIWLVTGPAGSGKSTVAKYLASSLNYSYVEGDEVRPRPPRRVPERGRSPYVSGSSTPRPTSRR